MCPSRSSSFFLDKAHLVTSPVSHNEKQHVGRENVWLPFILWSTALNAIFCVWVVGPSALSAVYREASSRDLGLVCIFSFLWGSGTACFSLGIQLVSPKFHHALVCFSSLTIDLAGRSFVSLPGGGAIATLVRGGGPCGLL